MATARWVDPIVEEVHQWRKELMDKANNDLATLVAQVRERQGKSGAVLADRQTISGDELRKRIREKFPDVEI